MATPRKSSGSAQPRGPKARTPEARETQLTALAYDLAERQMLDGSASAMVITHFLRLKTQETKLKEEKLRKENLLLEAKTETLYSNREAEAKYEEVLKAIRAYQGYGDDDEDL